MHVVLKELNIENFRGVRNGSLLELGKLSVLVGRNNTGKSTVLEAAYLLLTLASDEDVNRIAYRREGPQHVAHRYLLPFGRPGKTQIQGRVEIEAARVTFEYSVKGAFGRLAEPTGHRVPVELVDVHGGAWRPQLGPRYGFEGALSDAGKLGIQQLDEFRALGRKALEGLGDLQALQYDGEWVVTAVLKRGGHPVHFTGDGFRRVIFIDLAARRVAPGVLLIEEPECFQHWSSMLLLCEVLVDAVTRGTQVLLSTHSIEFIDRLIDAVGRAQGMTLDDLRFYLLRLDLDTGGLTAGTFTGVNAKAAREALETDLRG